MKKISFIIVLAIVLFGSGCQKENEIDTTTTDINSVHTEIADVTSTTNSSVVSEDFSTASNLSMNAFPPGSTSRSSSSSKTEASSEFPVQSYTDRSIRILEPAYTIKSGDTLSIGAILSPTDRRGVTFKWKVSDKTIVDFVYDEHTHQLRNTSHGCEIKGLKPGTVTLTINVTSKEGKCSDSCTITVTE